MPTAKRVVTGFSNYSDADFEVKAKFIATSMTDATMYFPTPIPSITDVALKITVYSNALANAEGGSLQDTLLKNEARTNLQTLLYQLSLYVEQKSEGDPVKIAASGFDYNKEPVPVGMLPKPSSFKVDCTMKGAIKLSIRAIKGSDMYQYEYKPTAGVPEIPWTVTTSTRSRTLITELESGKEYVFRVVALGTNPMRNYSDEITSFVL